MRVAKKRGGSRGKKMRGFTGHGLGSIGGAIVRLRSIKK